MAETHTDCRDEQGITVGLIDGMIAILRVLSTRDLTAPAVREVLEDLFADEDLLAVIKARFLLAPGSIGEGVDGEYMTLACLLLDRLGGSVTLTTEEIITMNDHRKVWVSRSDSLQDDTITISVE